MRLSSSLSSCTRTNTILIVLDSTGLKVYGEGKWKVRQHGITQRHTWTKLHLGMDPLLGEVVSIVGRLIMPQKTRKISAMCDALWCNIS